MDTNAKKMEELAMKRLARVEAAINLEEPDKVPLWGFGGDVISAYSGITEHEICFDSDKALMATEKFARDFPFDTMGFSSAMGLDGRIFSMAFAEYEDLSPLMTFITGPLHQLYGDRYSRFPGIETDENAPPQFLGGTFMEPEEYDDFIEDPMKFIAEIALPRICKNLEKPRDAMATWVRVGMELQRSMMENARIGEVAAKLGYPPLPLGWSYAPMDIIGDFLRGIDKVSLDAYRYPDKVLKAVEAIEKYVLDYSLAYAKMGFKYALIPLHLNEYLSPTLYNKFYWPSLKRVILALNEVGVKPIIIFEGIHDAHLETILELPKGWGVAYFEKTDVVKAKEVLKDHTCVMGGVPVSMIVSSTPEELDKYIKDLLEKVKPGGGFILTASIGVVPAITPPENISAIIDAVEKYGYY